MCSLSVQFQDSSPGWILCAPLPLSLPLLGAHLSDLLAMRFSRATLVEDIRRARAFLPRFEHGSEHTT